MLKNKRIAVYQRVSTDHQETASQALRVQEWLAANTVDCTVEIFEDLGVSGKTMTRPEFQRMQQAITDKQFDAVVTYRIDRVGRDAIALLHTLMDWMKDNIEFFAVDQPILQLGLDNPFRLTILAIFSELAQVERETLRRRVKAGMAAAKARGQVLGQPRKDHTERIAQIREHRRNGKTFEQIGKAMNISTTRAYDLYQIAKQA